MSATLGPGLPERARLPWRRSLDARSLRRVEHQWTAWTVAHVAPFIVGAGLLVWFKPVLGIVSAVLLVHAWALPELWANRGAVVVRTRTRGAAGPEARSLLLLGDLVDDANRRLHAASGLVLHPGALGVWVIGEAGALLVRPRARRVDCFCVRATGRDLPHGDRIAHLLLALRSDETDFSTVANLAFSGAGWRVRRRLGADQRIALDAAITLSHGPVA